VADSSATVLVQGESGTGKEAWSRARSTSAPRGGKAQLEGAVLLDQLAALERLADEAEHLRALEGFW